MIEFCGGLIVGIGLGIAALYVGAGYLIDRSVDRAPLRLLGGGYYIVPSREYSNLMTSRDLVRASIARIQATKRETEVADAEARAGANPFAERRTHDDPDTVLVRGERRKVSEFIPGPQHDLDVAGRPLTPGS